MLLRQSQTNSKTPYSLLYRNRRPGRVNPQRRDRLQANNGETREAKKGHEMADEDGVTGPILVSSGNAGPRLGQGMGTGIGRVIGRDRSFARGGEHQRLLLSSMNWKTRYN